MSKQVLEVECARLQERRRDHPESRVFAPLADTLRKLGRLEEALQVCVEGLEHHPDYSSAHVILGKIHLEREQSQAAARAFQRVLEIDDENLLALRHLAAIHESDGALAQALELWRRIRRIEPDSESVSDHIESLERRFAGEPRPESRAADPIPSPEPTESEPAETEPALSRQSENDPVARPEGASETDEPEAAPAGEEDWAERGADGDAAKASSAEIATITLAQIYYEQGFLAKALEIYEHIHARNPQLPGLEQRLQSIREELESAPARRSDQPAELDLDDLSPAPEAPIARGDRGIRSRSLAEARGDGSTEEIAVETRHGAPMTRRMHDQSEKARFENFRRWLEGISADDESESE